MEKVQFFDQKNLPDQVVTGADIVRSSNGSLQMTLKADSILVYSLPEKKTIYPAGLRLSFFGAGKQLRATMRADYGVSFDSKNTMEAKGNVVIIDHQTGDTSYLEQVVWDRNAARIYSNSPVRQVNGQRVTLGDGFESDENFECPLIFHQRGTILFQDE